MKHVQINRQTSIPASDVCENVVKHSKHKLLNTSWTVGWELINSAIDI